MIHAIDLTKAYEGPSTVQVFEGLDFTVERGKLVAIVGPSGAGKSTLLHLVGGLDRPTRGTLTFDGEDIFAWEAQRLARFRSLNVGFVFQFHHLLPEFTALENTMMPLLIRGEARETSSETARRILERVGLGKRVDHRIGEISGGEQQRVAIARALVGQPALLLADEPTGNLDHRTGDSIFAMIRELHAERQLTSIVVTHNDGIARQCDEVWELDSGHFRPALPTS